MCNMVYTLQSIHSHKKITHVTRITDAKIIMQYNRHKCKICQGSMLNYQKSWCHEKRIIYLHRRFWNFLHLWQILPLRSSRDVGWVDADFRRAAWLPSPRSFQAYSIAPLNAINQNQTVQKKMKQPLLVEKKIMPFAKDVYDYITEHFPTPM